MKISLIGYGKMGRMIEEIALQRGHTISCIIDIDNQEDFESEAFRSSDVAIEFTTPQAAYGNYLRAFAQGVKVVSGSTGWRRDHEEDVRRLIAEGNTLFWASNFSVGVALFSQLNRRLAELMNDFPAYDVSMVETHHVHKLDAPSGTAITLAEDILARLDRKERWAKGVVTDAEGKPWGDHAAADAGSDASDVLRIDAVREDEVPGIHTISYESDADLISITHSAKSRRGFALGAVLAAEYTHKHSGLLTIDDLFS